jgi:hypothetical protein
MKKIYILLLMLFNALIAMHNQNAEKLAIYRSSTQEMQPILYITANQVLKGFFL